MLHCGRHATGQTFRYGKNTQGQGLSSPLYDKCQPGTVVRPINIDLLHPSPDRAGHITGFGTPLGVQGQCEDVLTPDPTRAHHSIGVRQPIQKKSE